MKIIKKSLVAVLAVSISMLALVSCYSRKRNLVGVESSDSDERQAVTVSTLAFETTDINGKDVSMSDYAEAKVVMFNMWEPWCPPCRAELPDLQKLYEKYKSEGLMIVGVYSDEDGLSEIVKENGIAYPMIKSCAAFDDFESGYVPTTFITDGSGTVLSEESYIGSRSYDEWESVILSFLK